MSRSSYSKFCENKRVRARLRAVKRFEDRTGMIVSLSLLGRIQEGIELLQCKVLTMALNGHVRPVSCRPLLSVK